MIKGAKKNDPDIRIGIHVATGTTEIARITTISRKKSQRTKNTGATTNIIKEGVITTTTVRRTNVVDSKGLAGNIDNIGINGIMTKVWKMTSTRSHAGTNHKHLAISEE